MKKFIIWENNNKQIYFGIKTFPEEEWQRGTKDGITVYD